MARAPGLTATLSMVESICPACSPGYPLPENGRLGEDALAQSTLLLDVSTIADPAWLRWLRRPVDPAAWCGQQRVLLVLSVLTPDLACMDLKRCFPPVVNEHTRLLVLGSLPGEASLARQQYYAHPQNRFWELLGAVIGEDLRAMDYETRLATLLAHGVGLWDVIAEAERKGSLDAAIRNHSHNALVDLIAGLPALKAVAFNGGTSARIGRKQLRDIQGLQLIDLPSSSPAYTVAYAHKLVQWGALRGQLSLAGNAM